MKKCSVAVFALLLGSSFASAADMPLPYAPALWSWTGLYIGAHVGGGFVSSQFSDPAGASIYGDSVRSPAALAGFQLGYNWQIPNSNFLLGAEADASASIGDGTVTCLASSGIFVSANCRVRAQANGSLTGRVGYVTGPRGHILIYAKAGAAWLQEQIDITTNFTGFPPLAAASFDGVRWGWTIGAGVEKALTPAWSVRLEYDYANFGSLTTATPGSVVQVLPPLNLYLPTAGETSNVSQSLQTLKVGLNYKIGEDLSAQWEPSASDYRLRGATDPGYIPDAEMEVGGRVWYSSGKFQKDLGATFNPTQQNELRSRLTYDTTAASGEVFGRVDTSANIFLKGFVGGGKLLSGNMHDEDWQIFGFTVPYSNTVSTVKGDLAYATFDVGYSVFRGPSANVGGFVGYNYFRENKQAFGCAQIANSHSDCVPALANSVLVITEDDKWNSMRIGINSVVKVADRLTLTSDAAYLPFASFTGTDNHLLRNAANTVSPETATGRGVQLEAILSYAIANSFSVGAGGRYWAMWAPGSTDFFSQGCPCQTQPVRTERFGAFLQASYKLDGLK
jgi:opacity protein-like surface antigen